MILPWLYVASVLGLLAAIGTVVFLGVRRRVFRPFTTLELATASLLICLLHVVVVPWQIGLAKVPGLDALVFSIPYTAIFLLGLRLVPKPGTATLLIFGQGLFGQLLGRDKSRLVAVLFVVCRGCRSPAACRWQRGAHSAGDVGSRNPPGIAGLFLHVPDTGPFLVAPVLRALVHRVEDPDGPDRLRHRCRACLAGCSRDREGGSPFKPISGNGRSWAVVP